jgi:hypothetical protein
MHKKRGIPHFYIEPDLLGWWFHDGDGDSARGLADRPSG